MTGSAQACAFDSSTLLRRSFSEYLNLPDTQSYILQI
jgi:hypothetical protein